ncbi:MAG: DUF2924 domain-containing protein [Candidatus Acidiferrales bacterium]
MRANISGQIAKLRTLSRRQLLDLWQKLYRGAAPTSTRREVMVPFLAYRIQENVYGGLKPPTRSELHRIARSIKKSSASNEKMRQPKMKPGTRILRQWRGETYEVIVTRSGFEFGGASYRSLSELARKITGTRWSGPAFFGLKNSKPVLECHND